ncbi:DUF4276 family protein [Verminephrobacter aporrectodeae]|uniref:DUF4276 family protein n=1 Tax=Verminephrobacter aporrectodeae TaxID=1110389 RepID=UPI0022387A9B|nr:DUF4276 family protein [Verminephrobacter aporrectodeae]
MAIDTLHVLVEEPSMEVTLQQLLPCMLRQGIKAEIRQFQCKNDLLKQLPQRLAGYAQWLPETAMVLVIVDRDNDDCLELKARLEQSAHAAGLGTRKAPRNGKFQVINRIAIEELEAWFFGDWAAVKAAYPKVDAGVSKKPCCRSPDAIQRGTWEAMERELQKKAYFKQGLRKLELAQSVAKHMDISKNCSPSFPCLRDALAQL